MYIIVEYSSLTVLKIDVFILNIDHNFNRFHFRYPPTKVDYSQVNPQRPTNQFWFVHSRPMLRVQRHFIVKKDESMSN